MPHTKAAGRSGAARRPEERYADGSARAGYNAGDGRGRPAPRRTGGAYAQAGTPMHLKQTATSQRLSPANKRSGFGGRRAPAGAAARNNGRTGNGNFLPPHLRESAPPPPSHHSRQQNLGSQCD